MAENEMKRHSHNDEPAEKNSFFHKEFIKDIRDEIIHCLPPKSIGINGYWGAGKTSFLLQLQEVLKEENHISTVWFEAWRYQQDSLPIVALLNEIRAQMTKKKKLTGEIVKLTDIVLRGVASSFNDLTKAIQAADGEWRETHHQYNLPSQEIHSLLEDAIKHLLNNGDNARLVVFIDDLDRCQPKTAHRLLEGIKIYLNLKNCIVVLGMDRRQIEEILAEELKFHDDDQRKAQDRASDYLEKICQDIHSLPIADCRTKSSFFRQLLGELSSCNDAQTTMNYIKKIENIDYLPANPRKIKILVNRVAFMIRELDKNIKGEKESSLLLIVACLYCYHPKVYERFEVESGYFEEMFVILFPSEFEDIIDGNASSSPFMIPQGDPLEHVTFPVDSETGGDVWTNPNDSNVFRVYYLMEQHNKAFKIPTDDEVKMFHKNKNNRSSIS